MPSFVRQAISVGNLLLDTGNYRIVKQDSQKEARDAIIAEQGKKLVTMGKDIVKEGLNPIDLTLVYAAEDGHQNYVVIEGNRRLTAINLMLKPELADGTPLHTAFKKLNAAHADAIPKVIECVIVPSKQAGLIWINRKHQSGLEGAGTEPWSAIAKARADQDQGIARPDLDVVNFVLTNPTLNEEVRSNLQGSDFSITTLKRLVESKEMQLSAGFSLQGGKFVSDQDQERVQGILSEVVTIIATGKHDGKKFTEREIDSLEKREEFISSVASKHPKKKKAAGSWVISGKPVTIKKKPKKPTVKTTLSTEEQKNLIPASFKLELPSGKINDIFVELKHMDVISQRHAVSILFRVFFELSLDNYITKHAIQLPKDGQGRVVDKMKVRLQFVNEHVKSTKLMTAKELKPIGVAIGDENSLLAPDTLNAYVHSVWMNPDPLALKLTWLSIQLFIERTWGSKNSGHP